MSIRLARMKAGLTQKKVAELLGVTAGAVCQWEKGMNKPRLDKLVKLADLCGCTVDELIREK